MNMKRTLRIFFSAVIIRVKRLVSRPVKGQKTWPIRWSERDILEQIKPLFKDIDNSPRYNWTPPRHHKNTSRKMNTVITGIGDRSLEGKSGGVVIIDDPEEETTPEQREKLKGWYTDTDVKSGN